MSGADVQTIADWDIAALRRTVADLDDATDGLPGWHRLLNDASHVLSAGHIWSGPAALSAAGALTELSSMAAVVTTRLAASLWDLQRLVVEAAAAQEAAEEAMALAAVTGNGPYSVVLSHPQVDLTGGQQEAAAARFEALSEIARQRAAQAALAAAEATEDVGEPGHVAPLAPGGGYGGIPGSSGRPIVVPDVPTGVAPEAAAAWWARLSAMEQLVVVARAPQALGALAGVPARVRDQANRTVLARALTGCSGTARETAAAVAAQVAELEKGGQQAQVLELGLDEGLAAVSIGDVDTADAVGVFVPGTGNTVADDLDDLIDDAAAVGEAAEAAAPGLAVATVAWMSYRTPPRLRDAAFSDRAHVGGRALDATLDGLAAARVASCAPPARVVTYGHSYGAVVIDEAVDAPGDLASDAIVVAADPGMDGPASDLEVDEVYRARAPLDPIRLVPDDVHGWYGDDDLGFTELPTDWGMGHSDYYGRDHPTVTAFGEVLAGTFPAE
ncbi:hypothetical protein DQ238_21510 [Geodermatophilus sp. TF02-6]|uniref:alpha/beta hydrolase n=1 Tax=Geodermatophilus sp. TF02-6 TaxID=2250575 RepID=UPI000DEA30EA|nr:alpha/beta hydrolase [Geodermatophilus sp. TF02-6]RBY74663.1 hypothetical protein DQ238_21510 [Geodermatophilus sp. TF02-6]